MVLGLNAGADDYVTKPFSMDGRDRPKGGVPCAPG